MRPLFTIHHGEYLVATFLEEKYKSYQIWVPSKDTGVDLLVTNRGKRTFAGLQVKFSKDFSTKDDFALAHKVKSVGWWTLNMKKIEQSKADLWILVLYNFNTRNAQYLVIEPLELLRRLRTIHGQLTSFNVYIVVTSRNGCWETRGLSKKDLSLLINDKLDDQQVTKRDLSKYLDKWSQLESRLS